MSLFQFVMNFTIWDPKMNAIKCLKWLLALLTCLKVKWAKENYHHNIGSPYALRLATADASGKIIVWDVATGTARCEIQEHTKPIQGKEIFILHHVPVMNNCTS